MKITTTMMAVFMEMLAKMPKMIVVVILITMRAIPIRTGLSILPSS
ncbi:MAG: hypothetical protein ABSG49_11435 [Methanoregula sp.]